MNTIPSSLSNQEWPIGENGKPVVPRYLQEKFYEIVNRDMEVYIKNDLLNNRFSIRGTLMEFMARGYRICMEEYAAQQLQPPGTSDAAFQETSLVLHRLIKAIGTDKQQQRIDEANYIIRKYSNPLDALREVKLGVWISVKEDAPNDGEYLGCIEKTEECKAIYIRQRVVLNSMNKWVLTDGERLLFWMPLPPLPNRTPNVPVSDTTGSEDSYIADNQNNQENREKL